MVYTNDKGLKCFLKDTRDQHDRKLYAFEDLQKATHCSTGCGGCYHKYLDVIF